MSSKSIVKALQKKRIKISITNSSAEELDATRLLNFDVPSRFLTAYGDINPYITFDFKNYRGCVDKYVIRTTFDHYPINWQIQGSVNGKNFTILDERSDDICKNNLITRDTGIVVCGAEIAKTYEVKNQMCVRYLRLKQIGENSERTNNPNRSDKAKDSLYLSGFDVYGVPMSPLNLCFQTYKKRFKINQSLCLFVLLCLS